MASPRERSRVSFRERRTASTWAWRRLRRPEPAQEEEGGDDMDADVEAAPSADAAGDDGDDAPVSAEPAEDGAVE